MDQDLGDTERMLRDAFRRWFTEELEPAVPAMESGDALPYPLMRRMHESLGLDAMLGRKPADSERSEGGGTGGGSAVPGLDANAARYARTTFAVEMARVSPSFALSWGASTGLFGANVANKGTPEQVER
ncbi:MAG: acyl-CoA dehydrogenase family protein, partial [Alphaproteobacteria bacterium]